MKLQTLHRTFLALSISLFFSCSNNDDAATADQAVLVKKITETVYFGTDSETAVIDFSYQGSTLTRIDVQGSYQEFIYDGTKISSIKHYPNGVFDRTSTLSYNGNILMSIESDGNSERTDFIHTENGLSAIEHQYMDGGQWITFLTENYVFTPQRNVGERMQTYYPGGSTRRSEYTYDNNNSPMRDMNPYYRLISQFESFDPKNHNNPLTQMGFSPSNAPEGVVYSYEYVYNAQNFPTEIRRKHADGTLISLTVIEYN